jgi:hypothetical protein
MSPIAHQVQRPQSPSNHPAVSTPDLDPDGRTTHLLTPICFQYRIMRMSPFS